MRKFAIYSFGFIAILAIWTFYWSRQPAANEIRATRSYIQVDAPADKVWQVLTDTDHYPDWNPYIVSATGRLGVGSSLHIKEHVGGRNYHHSVTVTRLSATDRQFAWHGGMWPERLLHWDEGFRVEAVDATHSTVAISRAYQGLLLEAYWKIYNPHDLAAIGEMDSALKSRCEK